MACMKLAHLIFAGLMFAGGAAEANHPGKTSGRTPATSRNTLNLDDGPQVRQFLRAVKADRISRVRAGARFFKKIAIDKDYKNEHVVMANADVTAFLDMTDPMHPRFDPQGEAYDELEALPIDRRVHILVVPNKMREHLTETLGARIGLGDLLTTAKVVGEAEKLAQQLGVKNAKVFVNPSDDLSIGYLHVHIIGEKKPNQAYPRLTQAPN